MSIHHDVIVIGTGNAGQSAAAVACAAGLRVAIVEGREVGGTCALRGCVPKKVLVAAGEVMDVIRRAGVHAIHVGVPVLDWAQLIARERTFVAGVPAAIKADLLAKGIAVIEGQARFVGRDVIQVSGQAQPLQGDRFVVACGSLPRKLPFPGGDSLLTSDDLLELAELPASVAFVGAGVIAFELAHVMARAGAHVTLLEMAPRALPGLDADAVARLVDATVARGIAVQVNVKVQSVEGAADGPRTVHFLQGERAQALQVAAVAHGAGRVPAFDGLDLQAAGVTFEQGRPELDEAHRSRGNPTIWFAGDAVPRTPQLSSVATYEGHLVGRNIVRDEARAPDYAAIPSVVFTVPALASVGLTEAQARERGLSFEAKVNDMRTWRSARTNAEEIAWAKVLVDHAADRILGAHIVGHGAAETINAFALAIRHGISATELRDGVFAYPTFHSDLKFLI
jgi:glutathione reductase (NADPH)